jgi:broad specificity phosphatase PhoE
MKRIIFVRHGESTENKASTDNKSYDVNNIKLTELGEKQAMITGKYLYKVFGKFDKVYSSPATRCKETANMTLRVNLLLRNNIIMEEINYKKKLDINELLVEVGYNHHNLDGLSKDDQNKIFDSITINLPKDKLNLKLFDGIKTFRQLEKKLEETANPYDRLKIYNIWGDIETQHLGIKPNSTKVGKNYKKFLNNLKKTDDETILIVSHGACIGLLQRMICNINLNNIDIKIISNKLDTDKLFGNCCICCLEDNKYTLVSPTNTNHLK